MTRVAGRTMRWCAAVAIAAGLAACGGGDNNEVDAGPPTSHRRFPAAVVSTTTPSTTPFGVTAKPSRTTTTRKAAGGAATTAAPTTTAKPAGRTKPAETALPGSRTSLAATSWQGLVVVAGGAGSGGRPSVRVAAYDPKTGEWSRGPNLPVALRDASLSVVGSDLWIVGGFTLDGDQWVAQDGTYSFAPGDTAWRSGPKLEVARGGAAVAALGNFLVVLGGETTDGAVLDSVEVLAGGSGAWKTTQPMSTPRAYATALAMNGRIYAIGGKTDAATAVSNVESWRSGGSWRTESRLDKDRVRAGGAGQCVAGGQNDEGVVTTVECFGTGFWVTHAQMRVPRYGLAAVAIDGWLHLIGGSTAGTTVVNTHEVVDLSNVAS